MAVTSTSKGDMPIQPNNREARSPSKVVMKEAQSEEIKRTRLPPMKTGRLPNLTAKPLVMKQETPIMKIPQPSSPLSVL